MPFLIPVIVLAGLTFAGAVANIVGESGRNAPSATATATATATSPATPAPRETPKTPR
jgi:hypothetical protein